MLLHGVPLPSDAPLAAVRSEVPAPEAPAPDDPAAADEPGEAAHPAGSDAPELLGVDDEPDEVPAEELLGVGSQGEVDELAEREVDDSPLSAPPSADVAADT